MYIFFSPDLIENEIEEIEIPNPIPKSLVKTKTISAYRNRRAKRHTGTKKKSMLSRVNQFVLK